MKRTAVSKKVRFEIFKRDDFTCAYCGSKPPKTVLEVDHILPVSKGGTNVLDNLITSCFECNRGKSNISLQSIPTLLEDKAIIAAAKSEQYKAYLKHVKQIEKFNLQLVDMVEAAYNDFYPDYYFMPKFRNDIKMFIDKLGVTAVCEAMRIACSKFDEDQSLKYFCGICWNKIRQANV
jgi:hypothetical protein